VKFAGDCWSFFEDTTKAKETRFLRYILALKLDIYEKTGFLIPYN
jgi:hypothetical protein